MSVRSCVAWVAGVATALSAGCAPDTMSDPATSRSFDRAALSKLPRVDRVAFAADGVPHLIRGDLGATHRAIATVGDAEVALEGTLDRIAAPFGLAAADLVATRVARDRVGMTHVILQQYKEGLRVVSGDMTVHVAADGRVRSVTSSVRQDAVSPVPGVAAATAVDTARASTLAGNVDVGAPELVYLLENQSRAMHLAWQVEVTGRGVLVQDLVFVDAHTGAIIERHPRVYTAKNRVIRDGEGGTFPFIFNTPTIGTEGSPPTGDEIAMAAYDNTGTTYDCYRQLFGRDSYDGDGGELISLVHVQFLGPNGATPNNAAWAGDQMVYGDGDGEFFAPTPFGFDVTAHELTHGVITATANLTYMNESGALNEGMADIMAAVCEAWNDGVVNDDTWLIGEDIFTPQMDGDALRYMADPTADASLYPPELGGSRDFYADRYTGSEDNGGVHINSGIANLAFQLLVVGDSHPQGKTTFRVPGIGIEKAGEIFINALVNGYLNTSTNFAQMRTAIEESAGDLFGPAEVTAVGMAWAAVGIGEPPAVDENPPTVAITAPGDGDTVDAGFVVEVDASDDVGVTQVELVIDGNVVGTSSAAPYTFTTAADLASGPHTVEAIAYDAFNQATDSITVNVAAAGCTTDNDCPAGEECTEGGLCMPPDGGMCVEDADCAGFQTCEDGVCTNPNPGDGEGGGCGCQSGDAGGGAMTLLMLVLGVAFVTRRRRG